MMIFLLGMTSSFASEDTDTVQEDNNLNNILSAENDADKNLKSDMESLDEIKASAEYNSADETENNLISKSNDELLTEDAGTFSELKTMISGSASGATVNLYKNYTRSGYVDSSVQNGILINKELTIDGHGNTLDAEGTGSIFYINTNAMVTFNNITFINANSAVRYAGGVYANAKFLNCIFKDNSQTASGGKGAAIFFTYMSSANFTNVTFQNNRIYAVQSGTYYYQGGAIYIGGSANKLSLTNVNFEGNGIITRISSANAQYHGGAMYVEGSLSGAVFNNVNFTDNFIIPEISSYSAFLYGGAIYVSSDFSQNTFTDCNFIGNEAYTRGGVMYLAGSSRQNNFTNVNFTDNTVTTTKDLSGGGVFFIINAANGDKFTNVNFDHNGVILPASSSIQVYGQIVYRSTASNLIFDNVNFTNNYFQGDSNRPYYQGTTIVYTQQTTNNRILNSNFINNTNIKNSGSGIFMYKKSDGDTFYNVNFTNNSFCPVYAYDGDGLYNANFTKVNFTGSNPALWAPNFVNCKFNDTVFYKNTMALTAPDGKIDNCTFENVDFIENTRSDPKIFSNKFVNNKFYHVNFINNTGAENGACINARTEASNNEFYDVNFTQNRASSFGGAIYFYMASNNIFSNMNFTGNRANYGGAIYYATSASGNKYINTTFFNNTANGGGAIYYSTTSLNNKYDKTTFSNNTANNGGAIYINGGSSWSSQNDNFTDVNFTGNIAQNSGGAIYAWRAVINPITDEVRFIRNEAQQGAAIFFYTNNNNFNLYGLNFTENNAKGSASGVVHFYSTVSNVNLTNCTFSENNGIYGIYVPGGSQVNFIGSNFTDNKLNAVIYTYGIVNVDDCEFERNNIGIYFTAGSGLSTISNSRFKQGNGNAVYYVSNGYSPSFIISDSSFSEMNCTNVIHIVGGSVEIKNSNFTDNDCRAIYLSNSNENVISNVTFSHNTINCSSVGSSKGGVVWLEGSGKYKLDNCNFTNNSFTGNTTSFTNGGALYVAGTAKVTVNNTLFEKNTADYGGAIYIGENGEVLIDNSNLTLNRAVNGSAIYNKGTLRIENSVLLKNKANSTLTLNYDKFHNEVIAQYILNDNYINAVWTNENVAVKNVTYFEHENNIYNSDNVPAEISNFKAGFPIKFYFYDANDNQVNFTEKNTDENGEILFSYIKNNMQYIRAVSDGDDYYIGNVAFYNYTWGDFDELQSLVFNTSEGEVLVLERNFTYIIGLDTITKGIIVDKEITIDGRGYTINALFKSRVFDLYAHNIKFYNIHFVNASGLNGSFIHGIGVDNITVENCTFKSNTENFTLYSDDIIDSDLPIGRDGGIGLDGGFTIEIPPLDGGKTDYGLSSDGQVNYVGYNGNAIYIIGDNLYIKSSNFTNLSADCGGSVYVEGNNLLVEDSLFNNSFAAYGGAIWVYGDNVKVRSSKFKYNIANFAGGAIYAFGKNYEVTGSTFNMTAALGKSQPIYQYINTGSGHGDISFNEPVITSTVKFDNTDNYGGGAINAHVDNLNISNSAFWICSAQNSIGGAVYSNGTVTVTDSNFTYCDAEFGGAIYLDENAVDSVIDNCKFDSLEYYYNGGAILSYAGNTTVKYSKFRNISKWASHESMVTHNGGVICFAGNNSKVLYCNFTENRVEDISSVCSILWVSNDPEFLDRVIFDENNGVNGLIDNCIFERNYGIAVGLYVSNNTVQNCLFNNNTDGEFVLIHMGSNLLVKDSNFTNNYGILSSGIMLESNNVNITNCKFDSNVAEEGVGAIFAISFSMLGNPIENDIGNNMSIEDCTFVNNTGMFSGAVMMCGNGASIKNSNFNNNAAILSGALYLSAENINVTGSNFTNNHALMGGAVVVGNYSLAWMVFNRFSQHSEIGIYTGSFTQNNSIVNSNFINNSAEIAPGILWLDNNGLVENSTFENNFFKVYTAENMMNALMPYLSQYLEDYYFDLLLEYYNSIYDEIRYELLDYFRQTSGTAIYWDGENGTVNNCTFKDNNASTMLYPGYELKLTVVFENQLSKYNYYYSQTLFDYLMERLVEDFYRYHDTHPNIWFNQWLDGVEIFVDVCSYNEDLGKFEYNLRPVYIFEYISEWEESASGAYAEYFLSEFSDEFKWDYYQDHMYMELIEPFEIFYQNHSKDLIPFYDYGQLIVIYQPVEIVSHSASKGGAIFWQGPNGLVNDSIFINNNADDGGAIFASIIDGVSPYLINNSIFINNSAVNGGGAIVVNGNNIVVDNSQFSDNYAEFHFKEKTATLSDDEFSELNNTAFMELVDMGYEYLAVGKDIMASSGGGAILWIGENGIIKNSNFTLNTADNGGAIVFYGITMGGEKFSFSDNSSVINCKFENNSAEYAGAIDWLGEDGKIINSIFEDNRASYAGAVLAEGSNIYIQANFTNNTAITGGAAIILKTAMVNASRFISNIADDFAGALYFNSDNVTVNGSYFELNTANRGGAIYGNGNNFRLLASEFVNNHASDGGAIFIIGDAGVIKESKFFNNTATYAGAAYISGNNWNIETSEFRYNKADFGSALYNTGSGTLIKSTVLLDNQAGANSLIFTYNITGKNITVDAIFTGHDNFLNAIYTLSVCRIEDVTYWSSKGITNSDSENPLLTTLEDGINITLELYDASFVPISTVNMTNINGKARFALSDINKGRYFMVVKHYEDTYYTAISNEGIIQIGDLDTSINVQADDIFYRENETIKVTVPKDAKGNITFEIDGINFTTENLTEGFAMANKSGLQGGVHNLTVYYSGDENYRPISTSTTFTVKPIPSSLNITTEGGNYKDNITVNVTVEIDAKEIVIVTIEDKFGHTLIINDTNHLQTIVNSLNAGEYNVTAYYVGDNNYLPSTNWTSLTVKPIDLNPEVTATNVTVAENTTFTITVPDDFVGYVNITVANVSQIYHIAGSTHEIFVNLPAGDKAANVTFYGDNNYNDATVYPVNFTVVEVPDEMPTITLNIPDTTYPNNTTAKVNVSGRLNGTAVIVVDKSEFTLTITNGTGSVNLSGLSAGVKIANITFTGENGLVLKASEKFVINKAKSEINIAAENHDVIVNVTAGATGNVTFYVNGEKQVIELNGSTATWKNVLKVGINNTIVVVYEGDVNYTESENYSDVYIEKLKSLVNVTANRTVYGDDAIITVYVPIDQKGYVTIKINNAEYTQMIKDTKAVFSIPKLEVKSYDVNVTYLGDDKYDIAVNSTTLEVIKANITAEVIGLNVTVNDNTSFIISNIPADFNGKVNITVDGIKYSDDVNSLIVMAKLSEGNKTANVVFWNSKNYNDLVLTANFTVSKVTSSTTVNVTVKDVTYGENATANISVSGKANGTLAITVDGRQLPEINIENGFVSIDLGILPGGVKDIKVNFTSNDNINTNATANTKFTVRKAKSDVSITVSGRNVTARVTAGATGNVTFYVDGVKQIIEVTNGSATWQNCLEYANNTIVVVYEGDVNYTESENNTNFFIDKLPSFVNVTAQIITYGNPAVITVNVPSAQSGYVTITVDDAEYTHELNKGQAVFTISGLPVDEYNVRVIYLGDSIYENSTNSTKFNVVPADLNASVIAENITVIQNSEFIISVHEDFKGKVNITVDGIVYSGDANPLVTMDKLTAGSKTANVVFYGDPNYNNQTLTVSFVVSKLPVSFDVSTVNADNMTRGYNSPFDYQAAFLDAQGNALKNIPVEFRVNGKTYKATTNDDGIAHLTQSKLDIGVYDITSVNTQTGEEVTCKLTIVARILENKDLTMDFRDGSYFVVKVIGDDGKIAPEGEIICVMANGIRYVAKVNGKGYAKLKIKLKPRKYVVVCEYKTYKTTNKLVVKQTLKLVKKTVKVKKGKKIVIKAKLKWSNGKAIKGKKIVFKFKGKKYKAKTNKKGIAQFTIKAKITKKLKKGKSYVYTASYYTNTVKGKLKVK